MKIILLIGAFLIATCASNNKPPENSNQTVKNYTIESVTELSQKPSQKSATFLVKGILPSPAYSVQKIEIEQKKNEITLNPIIVHDPNKIVIQMAVPFEEEIEIKNINQSCKINVDGKIYVKSFSFKE